VLLQPKLARSAAADRPGSAPIAASTCEGATLPDEQVAPALMRTPSRSSAISAVSDARPGIAKLLVLQRRSAAAPKITVSG
jgi:hypothetical protein